MAEKNRTKVLMVQLSGPRQRPVICGVLWAERPTNLGPEWVEIPNELVINSIRRHLSTDRGTSNGSDSDSAITCAFTVNDHLITIPPEKGGLIPPSVGSPLDPGKRAPETPQKGDWAQAAWEDFRAAYPKRSGAQGWPVAEQRFAKLATSPAKAAALVAGAENYRRYCDLKGNTGTEYVKQAATFLSPAARAWEEFQDSGAAGATPQPSQVISTRMFTDDAETGGERPQ